MGKNKILLVDDEQVTAMAEAARLENHGFEVETLHSGEEALQYLKFSEDIDIILMDIELNSDLDGIDTANIIQESYEIPLIFLTSHEEPELLKRVKDIGAYNYLLKDTSGVMIANAIHQALTLHKARQRIMEQTEELAERNKELDRLASLDGLTRLCNKRVFNETLNKEWERLKREKRPLSLLFLDIDFFKQYNDFYGHQQGDECLKKIAGVLNKEARRPADLAARYGGEEFVILLPNTPESGAWQKAKAVQQSIKAANIDHEKSKVSSHVTCSIGVAAVVPNNNFNPDEFLDAADEALYEAKESGRDRAVKADF